MSYPCPIITGLGAEDGVRPAFLGYHLLRTWCLDGMSLIPDRARTPKATTAMAVVRVASRYLIGPPYSGEVSPSQGYS